MNLFHKLFLSPNFFTIAIRHKAEKSIIEEALFEARYVMPATRLHWQADPMLVEDDKDTYLFYEAFHRTKGRLEVVKVYPDCSVSRPTVILESEYHYSYPFVFKVKDKWYMVPESSEEKKVVLYEAVRFPYEWKEKEILLEEKAVDSTIFMRNGIFYLLTFLPREGSERVIPIAFKMHEKNGKTDMQRIEWTGYDELQCRGAGGVFAQENELVRPAQVSLDHSYGEKLKFYRIDNNEDCYLEKECGELLPDNVTAKKWWFDGLHTYTVSSRFEAIDIRCRKFDLLKVPRTIISKLR